LYFYNKSNKTGWHGEPENFKKRLKARKENIMDAERIEELERLEKLTVMSGQVLKAASKMKGGAGIHLFNAVLDGALPMRIIPRLLAPPHLRRNVKCLIAANEMGEYLALRCFDKKEGQHFLIFTFAGNLVHYLQRSSFEENKYSTLFQTQTKIFYFYKTFGGGWGIRIIEKNPERWFNEKGDSAFYDVHTETSSFHKVWYELSSLSLMKDLCEERPTIIEIMNLCSKDEGRLQKDWATPGFDGRINLSIDGKGFYEIKICNSSPYLIAK